MRIITTTFLIVCLVSAAMASSPGRSLSRTAALPNPILFVTQVPIPQDTNTVTSVFSNHNTVTSATGRGGDLYILYPDGTTKNLTAAAGYGNAGFQGATSIDVRDPSVYWDGTKALFSMVVGGPTSQNDVTVFQWQIYEITGLGKLETPSISKIANQPAFNNIYPIYGTDDRIIFVSDRPRNGEAQFYPQLDEYRTDITNSGLYSLDPSSGNLIMLDHAPSGDFHPTIDSYGRVIMTRWDHLQRDSQADKDIMVGNTFGSFNYSDETAGASVLAGVRTEVFPEPQNSRTDLLAGTNINGMEFNRFFPWQINEDGTEMETINHVGRHDLSFIIGPPNFNDDPNLTNSNYISGVGRVNQNPVNQVLQIAEDPTNPGRYYATDATENGTHGGGQIFWLQGPPTLDAQDMYVTYVTDRSTANPLSEAGSPNATYTGHYRDPLPLSDGNLIVVHSNNNKADRNIGTGLNPISRDTFRLKTMKIRTGSIYMADQPLIAAGITKNISYWTNQGMVSYNGPMWELSPVEVRARTKPNRRVAKLPAPERAVMLAEGIDTVAFVDYLKTHNLALIVSRDITNRNTFDKQQPYYLKVHNSATQSANPSGKVYDVAGLQVYEGDYLRGYGLGNPGSPGIRPGRRILAQVLNDTSVHNPPYPGGPQGSVALGSDGSQAMFVPAHRALSWQLNDSAGVNVVRERFWVTMASGEIRVCASCHGANGEATTPKQFVPVNEPEALHTLLQYWKTLVGSGPPPPPGSHPFAVSGSWNLVSVPLTPADNAKTALFPTATSNAFAYTGSYVNAATLSHGQGYWLKFSGAQTVNIIGTLTQHDTISVNDGWNLVGSIGTTLAVGAISSNPPGMVTSNFFAHTAHGYAVADSIVPGKAYWVKTTGSGVLMLDSTGSAAPKNHITIIPTRDEPPAPPASANRAEPGAFALQQNYPNPFNPSTEISYQLGGDSRVLINVYNTLGQNIRTLVDMVQDAGAKTTSWDGTNSSGLQVPSGVYLCRISVTDLTGTRQQFNGTMKMLLVR